MDIEKTLYTSGLQKGEFAELCSVSRMTVHAWCKGEKMNPLRQPRVDKLLAAINAATKAKDFPIVRPHIRGVGKELVMSRIKSVILKHLGALTKSR